MKAKKRIKKPLLFFIIIVVLVFALSSLWIFSDYGFVGKAVKMELIKSSTPQCSDGLDNDHDGFVDWGFTNTNDPSCSSPFGNSEAIQYHKQISWNDFPNFNLNSKLTAVYSGIQLAGCYPYCKSCPCVENVGTAPLRKGFTHIGVFEGLEPKQLESLPPQNRAIGFSPFGGNAGLCDEPEGAVNQPFNKYSIPWNNSLTAFTKCMDKELAYFANLFSDSKNDIPQADILISDIERNLGVQTNQQILNLRKNPEAAKYIPDAFKQLSDQEFLTQYKHDMAWFYNFLNEYSKLKGFTGKIGSYGDVPLDQYLGYNGWLWSEPYTFNQWTSNEIFTKTCSHDDWKESCATYITFNFGEYMNKPKSDFYSLGPLVKKTLDVLAPSGYYAYGYGKNYDYKTWETAGSGLIYELFSIDANKAFSQEKPIMIHQWMRSHAPGISGLSGLDPWLAHASAIFPYFTKNVGQYVWDSLVFDVINVNIGDSVHTENQISENRIAYDNFIYGLYRLSKYNEFFNGNYETYRPKDARELYQLVATGKLNEAVLWRGIIKENGKQMLVAAYNPYAKFDQVTTFEITCPPNQNCQYSSLGTVQTTGLNVWLGICNLETGGCVGDQGEKVVKQPVKTGIREPAISKKKIRTLT